MSMEIEVLAAKLHNLRSELAQTLPLLDKFVAKYGELERLETEARRSDEDTAEWFEQERKQREEHVAKTFGVKWIDREDAK